MPKYPYRGWVSKHLFSSYSLTSKVIDALKRYKYWLFIGRLTNKLDISVVQLKIKFVSVISINVEDQNTTLLVFKTSQTSS